MKYHTQCLILCLMSLFIPACARFADVPPRHGLHEIECLDLPRDLSVVFRSEEPSASCTVEDLLTAITPDFQENRAWAYEQGFNLEDRMMGCVMNGRRRVAAGWQSARLSLFRNDSRPMPLHGFVSDGNGLRHWNRAVDFPPGSGSARTPQGIAMTRDGSMVLCVFALGFVAVNAINGEVLGWEFGPYSTLERIDEATIDGRTAFRLVLADESAIWLVVEGEIANGNH